MSIPMVSKIIAITISIAAITGLLYQPIYARGANTTPHQPYTPTVSTLKTNLQNTNAGCCCCGRKICKKVCKEENNPCQKTNCGQDSPNQTNGFSTTEIANYLPLKEKEVKKLYTLSENKIWHSRGTKPPTPPPKI